MSARICALGACPVTSVRGIDVPVPTTTFLKPPYDPGSPEDTTHLTAPPDQTFFHVVMRNATREILQVNFRTAAGRTWTLFANHWPSRSGGAHESAGHRHIAGETLAYFHQRALDVHGDDTPALAMGDFNDEPFDTSMLLHPLSTRQRQKVTNARSPRLWNLMWPAMGGPEGTLYYNNEPNIRLYSTSSSSTAAWPSRTAH